MPEKAWNMLIDLVVVDRSRDFCSAIDAELRDALVACGGAPVTARVVCGDLLSAFGVARDDDEKCRDDEFETIACAPILDDQTPTFVVFGGNTAGVAAGNAQRAMRRAFPLQFREIAAQAAFDRVRGPEVAPGPDVTSDSDIDAFVRANANSAYHLCGTCRIGTDAMAVVDPKLRVRGIDGLRVADASVMPSITNGNTNAPSLMIGEKAAQMIRGNRSGAAAA